MTRGVLYMIWGNNEVVNAARPRAIASLKIVHPEMEYHVARMPDNSDLRCKAQMFDLSPFDTTIYLDADTVVLGGLSHAFDKAEQHGLTVSVNPHPWANRYAALHAHGEIIEYDTGVVAFSKRPAVKHLFDAWKAGHDMNSCSFFMSSTGLAHMLVNDQCAFAHAVHSTGFNPFVLPVNWNLHPKWQKTVFGPIKIWHDYREVPPGVYEWNAAQTAPGAVMVCGGIP